MQNFPKKTTFPMFRLIAATLLTAGLTLPLGASAADSMTMPHHNDDMSSKGSDSMGHMHHHDMKMTGNVDYDFAMMMKMHHEKGLKMAQQELDKGKDPAMKDAAKKIIDTQKKEIADFEQWMAKHPVNPGGTMK